jgi:HAD superfamily hydrolase (TIGR01549 family)
MDGTLIESTAAVPDSYIRTITSVTPESAPLTRQDIFDRYHLGPPPNILLDLLKRPAQDHEVEQFHRELAQLAEDVAVYSGVVELLELLSERAVRLAVFTGADTRSAQTLLRATGLMDRFEIVMGSDEIRDPKPAPEGLIEVARRLNVSLADCVYVGDSPLDITCARAAGARPIAAGWGHLFSAAAACDIAHSPAQVVDLL